MNIFDFLQFVGGIILAISYIPQIVKLRRDKNAEGLSSKFFAILTLGLFCMLINAIHLVYSAKVISYAITQMLNVILSFTVLMQIKKYSK